MAKDKETKQKKPKYEKPTITPICGAVTNAGQKREPLACAYPKGHDGPHAWDSLLTERDAQVQDEMQAILEKAAAEGFGRPVEVEIHPSKGEVVVSPI